MLVCIYTLNKKSSLCIKECLQELNVKSCLISPKSTPILNFSHIILSGSEKHVYNDDAPQIPDWISESNVPVLGICFGMEAIAYKFGGEIIRLDVPEIGPKFVCEAGTKKLRWMNRQDGVLKIPKNFRITGFTELGEIASFTDDKKWWAVQYHPERPELRDISIFKEFLFG